MVVDGARSSGSHEAAVAAGRLSPGEHVVRLVAGAAKAIQRLTVVR